MDKKLEEKLDEKLDKKLEEKFEEKLKPIHDEIRYIKEELLENIVIPRLNEIESCYLDTYKRYQRGVDQIEAMQADIDVLKCTVQQHSEILQKIS